jgi:hypothetical protein
MVNEEDYNSVKELISDYLDSKQQVPKEFKSEYSLFDRIRVIIEAVLFGWIIPGTKQNWKKLKED